MGITCNTWYFVKSGLIDDFIEDVEKSGLSFIPKDFLKNRLTERLGKTGVYAFCGSVTGWKFDGDLNVRTAYKVYGKMEDYGYHLPQFPFSPIPPDMPAENFETKNNCKGEDNMNKQLAINIIDDYSNSDVRDIRNAYNSKIKKVYETSDEGKEYMKDVKILQKWKWINAPDIKDVITLSDEEEQKVQALAKQRDYEIQNVYDKAKEAKAFLDTCQILAEVCDVLSTYGYIRHNKED